MSTLRKPMHPGKFLYKAYMEPSEITITDLAEKLGLSTSSISRLVSGKSELSYAMAVRLSKVFKRTPEGWMNLQVAYGLSKAREEVDLSVIMD